MVQNEHNYLIHWLKKGEKAKYIDKVKLANGRWRYFYTQAEVDAYKRGLSKSAGSLADKAKQGLHNLKEGALNTGARAVVGVAKRNNAISDRLGGSYLGRANNRRRIATDHQNEANALNRSASQDSATAASYTRSGTARGLNKIRAALDSHYSTELSRRRDNGDAYRSAAESKRNSAQEHAERASHYRAEAADLQKKYDNSVLGRAEARVAADDRRKAQQPKPAKQTARKSSGESLGSRASRALGRAKEAAADRAAEAVVGAANRSNLVRNAIGGKHEDSARRHNDLANTDRRIAREADRKAHEDSAAAARQDRKYGSGGDAYRRSAEINREKANTYAEKASDKQRYANSERERYESSLLGRAQARVNRKGKKSSSKKKSNRKKIRDGLYMEAQKAKIGR